MPEFKPTGSVTLDVVAKLDQESAEALYAEIRELAKAAVKNGITAGLLEAVNRAQA